MNEIKVYIKVDPSKELHWDGCLIFNEESACYVKEVSLTELMVGFAEWCAYFYKRNGENWIGLGYSSEHSTKELIEIYLTEKGIVLWAHTK